MSIFPIATKPIRRRKEKRVQSVYSEMTGGVKKAVNIGNMGSVGSGQLPPLPMEMQGVGHPMLQQNTYMYGGNTGSSRAFVPGGYQGNGGYGEYMGGYYYNGANHPPQHTIPSIPPWMTILQGTT